MGLRFRKSKKVGPFRFTLTKSGVSTSFGGKGFRVTSGPRGTHLTSSYGGFVYREKLGAKSRRSSATPATTESIFPEVHSLDSASVEVLRDVSMAGFAEPFGQEARARMRSNIFTICYVLSAIIVFPIVAKNGSTELLGSWMIVGAIGFPWAIINYWVNRVKVKFEVPPEFQESVNVFEAAAVQLASSALTYHTDGVHRQIKPRLRMPFGRKSEVHPIELRAGKEFLFVFPDRVLILSHRGAAAVPLTKVTVVYGTDRVHLSNEPHDASIVGRSWAHARQDGGPDRRFSDNPSLAVAEFGTLHFTSVTGLNERFLFSNKAATEAFAELINEAKESVPSIP